MSNVFFELLQVSLGTRDKLSRMPSAAEWGQLFEEAERQAVAGVMLDGLERLPAEQWPPLEVKLEWIGEVQVLEAASQQNLKRTKELVSRFLAVGFESCVLKGVATARYYPHPMRRQMGDIDLWVKGRREDVMAWLRSQFEIDHLVWHNVGVEFFEDVPVEVHFHPAWLYHPIHNWRLQRFFESEKNTQMTMRENGYAYTSVGFDAVYSLVHTYRHILTGGVGMRHVVDYYYICHHLDDPARRSTMTILQRLGLARFAAAMMYVLSKICRISDEMLLCEPNEKEGEFLLHEIMAGGNFGQSRTDGKGVNSFCRWSMMIKHYPSEVLWMMPWKCWHWCWRTFNR